ncbi:DegT/DnrJ/EryC1/StrS family aminotransferase [Sphaerochaeta sp. PS]|uniref:DegT/DnrJ/EryC1/StrS family aminotransferase n=1 Tax=Sphaerochaeta sp. PS TaxID=3076336 RepID=UPI0028A4B4A0|nr:DegT/DnrJ/EryC1/StrS family aminotransferase [Sphaerochaeta sp. PS]MDT4762906.1 DegT/DnrJ/EryC1/StrS family aminotransferase [Sphaerochaeta sp. PS]
MALIRFYKPTIRRKDMDAVLQTMVDEKIGPGERTGEFLRQFCTLVGMQEGIALRSYVDALTTALKLCGITEGSLVGVSILSPSLYETVIENLGAKVLLGDIDPEHGCLSLSEATRLVSEGAQALLIHEPMCQIPYGCDYRQLGVKVVEDITQSLESVYEETKAGSFGNLVVCAFEEDCIVSTGGGAALVFNDHAFSAPLKHLYRQVRNYEELPDMNAALGIIQLANLPAQVAKRTELYNLYRKSLLKTAHKLFGIGNIDFMPNGYGFCVVLDSKAEDAIKFANKYQVSAKKTFEDSLGSLHSQRFDLFPHAVPPLLRALSFPTYPFLKQGDIEMLMKVLSHLP